MNIRGHTRFHHFAGQTHGFFEFGCASPNFRIIGDLYFHQFFDLRLELSERAIDQKTFHCFAFHKEDWEWLG
jgi:hypothetical protein